MKFLLTPLLVFIFSCSNEQASSTPDIKNSRIPEDAFFVKGIDTGYWCKADIHSHRNNATISVYSSKDGKLLMIKNFYIVCKEEDNPLFIEDMKKQVDYFDGERFHLKRQEGKDSCWLQSS